MKRKLIALLLCVAVLSGCNTKNSSSTPTTDSTVQESVSGVNTNGFEYSTASDNGTSFIIITGYSGTASELTIPENIDGYPVEKISVSAFKDNTSLKSVVLPDTLKQIGYSAFKGCSSLESITFPKNLTDINGYAFNDTPWLEKKKAENSLVVVNDRILCGFDTTGEVIIPDNIKGICSHAFFDNTEITSVTIPESCTEIGPCAFASCFNLENVELKNGLKTIGYEAFNYCKDIVSVNIPESVELIGYSAFRNCSSLENISIPEGLINIDSKVFSDTPWMEKKQKENPLVIVNGVLIDGLLAKGEITVPENIKKLAPNAFYGNQEITKIVISDNITEIPSLAFAYCPELEEAVMSDSVTSISLSAFKNCPKLKKVTFSDNLVSVGNYAFDDCPSLTEFDIPDNVDISIFRNILVIDENITEEITANHKGQKYIYNGEYFDSSVSSSQR